MTDENYDHVQCTHLWMCGYGVPSSCTKEAPALRAYLICRAQRSWRHVVGVSLAAPSAFFKGENSSSRRTSHAAKFLSHFTQTTRTQQRTKQGRREKWPPIYDQVIRYARWCVPIRRRHWSLVLQSGVHPFKLPLI